MHNDIFCMRPGFFKKWTSKRDEVNKNAGLMAEAMKINADDLDDQYKRVFKTSGRTATITIDGPLSPDGPDFMDVFLGYNGTAYTNIQRAAAEALELHESGDIDNVIIKMNTPGGTVDQVGQTHQVLKSISDFSVVYNEGDIASAGVWLASAIEKVYPRTASSMIGSIGVVVTYYNSDEALKEMGYEKIEIVNSKSPNKRPDLTTEEGVDVIRRELDDIYDVFADAVAAGRPITRKKIDSLNGEMFISSKAVELGLMDAPPTVETTEKAEQNIEEMENSEMELIYSQDDLDSAISAERERLSGLIEVSKLSVQDSFLTAVETGISVGNFSIEKARSEKATAKLEVEAARKRKEDNLDESFNIDSKQDENIKEAGKKENTKTAELEKCDEALDKHFKKGVK